jgi:hypothetical protein
MAQAATDQAGALEVTDVARTVPLGGQRPNLVRGTVEGAAPPAGCGCDDRRGEAVRSSDGVVGADSQQVVRLRALSTDMVVELQRADTKAAALCAAAGGLLTADITALSVLGAPLFPRLALLVAAVLLATALGSALRALRPALPHRGRRNELLAVRCGADAEFLVASLAEMSCADQWRMEEHRLSVMALLARRKFRTVRLAVDLISGALLTGGFGLLVAYLTY